MDQKALQNATKPLYSAIINRIMSTMPKVIYCHNFPIPAIEHVPKDCYDLDNPKIIKFLDGNKNRKLKRADCLVHYRSDGTAVIELKRGYMKKTRLQIASTIESMRRDWSGFVQLIGAGDNLPFPTSVILCMEHGLGNDSNRYEIDDNHFLREKTTIGKYKGPKVDCMGILLKVYSKEQIMRFNKTWRP